MRIEKRGPGRFVEITETETELTPEQVRRAIAEDVIYHLDAGEFRASSVYLSIPGGSLGVGTVRDAWAELMKRRESDPDEKCTVCAIGAAYASAALPYDSKQYTGCRDRIHESLIEDGLFTKESLHDLEAAFERTVMDFDRIGNRLAARAFNAYLPTDEDVWPHEDRLRYLMGVILAYGDFSALLFLRELHNDACLGRLDYRPQKSSWFNIGFVQE